jgi:hypothetical protein
MARRPLQFSLLTLLLALGIVPAVMALLYMWAGDFLYAFVMTVPYFGSPFLFPGTAALFWLFLGLRVLPGRQGVRKLATLLFVVVIVANVWPRFMSPGEIRLDTGSPTNSLWWMRMGVPFVWLEFPSTWLHLMGFSIPEAKPRWIVPIGIVVNILIAAAVAYLAAGIITMACSFRRVHGDPVAHASEPERLNTGEEGSKG